MGTRPDQARLDQQRVRSRPENNGLGLVLVSGPPKMTGLGPLVLWLQMRFAALPTHFCLSLVPDTFALAN